MANTEWYLPRAKYRLIQQPPHTLLLATVPAKQRINLREVSLLSSGKIPQFVCISAEEKQIVCNITGLVSLETVWDAGQFSEKLCLSVCAQLLSVLNTMQDHYLYPENLLLHPGYLFLTQKSARLKFVYLPLVSSTKSINFKNFLLAMLSHVTLAPGESGAALQKLYSFLAGMTIFSAYQTEKFLSYLCGVPCREQQKFPTQNIHKSSLVLVCARTGETVPVTEKICSVGKPGGNADFSVSGNSALSRIHFEVYREGGTVFLRDCHSANGCTLNGQRLPPGKWVALHEGQRFKAADDSFELLADTVERRL